MIEEQELTTYESLPNDEMEESSIDQEPLESDEQEFTEVATDQETESEISTYETTGTTTTAITSSTVSTVVVDAESLNNFTRSANYLMCFFVIYFVCRALYRLINIFF